MKFLQLLTDGKDDIMYMKKIEEQKEKEPKEKFTAAPKYRILDDGPLEPE